jgi:hypothetical protein
MRILRGIPNWSTKKTADGHGDVAMRGMMAMGIASVSVDLWFMGHAK